MKEEEQKKQEKKKKKKKKRDKKRKRKQMAESELIYGMVNAPTRSNKKRRCDWCKAYEKRESEWILEPHINEPQATNHNYLYPPQSISNDPFATNAHNDNTLPNTAHEFDEDENENEMDESNTLEYNQYIALDLGAPSDPEIAPSIASMNAPRTSPTPRGPRTINNSLRYLVILFVVYMAFGLCGASTVSMNVNKTDLTVQLFDNKRRCHSEYPLHLDSLHLDFLFFMDQNLTQFVFRSHMDQFGICTLCNVMKLPRFSEAVGRLIIIRDDLWMGSLSCHEWIYSAPTVSDVIEFADWCAGISYCDRCVGISYRCVGTSYCDWCVHEAVETASIMDHRRRLVNSKYIFNLWRIPVFIRNKDCLKSDPYSHGDEFPFHIYKKRRVQCDARLDHFNGGAIVIEFVDWYRCGALSYFNLPREALSYGLSVNDKRNNKALIEFVRIPLMMDHRRRLVNGKYIFNLWRWRMSVFIQSKHSLKSDPYSHGDAFRFHGTTPDRYIQSISKPETNDASIMEDTKPNRNTTNPDSSTEPPITNITKRRDSLTKFKESARKLSMIFGHGALSIEQQQIDDKWILISLFTIFILCVLSTLLHLISIHFIMNTSHSVYTDTNTLSLYTHYASYLCHMVSRFVTFWLFLYLLYFVVYNKHQSVIHLSIFRDISNDDTNQRRYIVCGNGKILSLIFCAIFVIGCTASIVQHSANGFIVNYLLYAICDCLYALLFGITSKRIHYAAYKQFKARYVNQSSSSASIVYAKNVFDVGIKSVIIISVIGITHAVLIVALLSSLVCNVMTGDDGETMQTMVNTVYLWTVTTNCLSVALLFKYSECAYNILCKCHKPIVNALDDA